MAERRVVVTGLGVLAPNGHGLDAYEDALRQGRSGIRFFEELRELKFSCQVGGKPEGVDALKEQYFTPEVRFSLKADVITYGCIAALDCWRDAGLNVPESGDDAVDWDSGAVVGVGLGGIELACDVIAPRVNAGKVRRLGSTMVEQTMMSGVSARLGGLLHLGGQVTTNSSACTTGTEAIVMGYRAIREGRAKRMLAGGAETAHRYLWGSFDAMRVLASRSNDEPERASRPMSASASGFVPGSGAGILMLEELETARRRGARIYAEIVGANVNSGGHCNGGSMTAPNPEGVRRCIRGAVAQAGVAPREIDAINGHLTATFADPHEVRNWQHALELEPAKMPWINSTKSLIGHGLGAAGGLECVATVLQLHKGFVHGSLNCEDLHPELSAFAERIPHHTLETPNLKLIAKASFGFGDVNGCLIFRRWESKTDG